MSQALIAAAIALIPTLIWGYLFITQDPQCRGRLLITFLAGLLSVAPLMLILNKLGDLIERQENAADVLTENATSLSGMAVAILEIAEAFAFFGVFTLAVLIVIALLHVVHLLHSRTTLRALHVVSIMLAGSPLAIAAVESLHPGFLESLGVTALWLPMPAYLANLALLAYLTVMPLIRWLKHATRQDLRIFAALIEEPLNFIGFGIIMALAIAVLGWFALPSVAVGVVFLASAEEYSKHLVVRFTDDDSIRSVDDAIMFSVMVGLAFAFAENILWYLPKLMAEGNTGSIVWRCVLTVPMHAVASGLFGYYYGLAHFASEELRSSHAGRHPIIKLLHRTLLFRRSDLYHEAKMLEGLLLAGTLHATFNHAAFAGNVFLMLLVVLIGMAALLFLLGRKQNQIQLGDDAIERHPESRRGKLALP